MTSVNLSISTKRVTETTKSKTNQFAIYQDRDVVIAMTKHLAIANQKPKAVTTKLMMKTKNLAIATSIKIANVTVQLIAVTTKLKTKTKQIAIEATNLKTSNIAVIIINQKGQETKLTTKVKTKQLAIIANSAGVVSNYAGPGL